MVTLKIEMNEIKRVKFILKRERGKNKIMRFRKECPHKLYQLHANDDLLSQNIINVMHQLQFL